ncbi:MAG: DUF2336 domain-containing protein [Devosia sp.]
MVAYGDFVALSQSGDSEDRGTAAHFAAKAYLAHTGPADEHAALYASLIGFLDDPSVRVRAALAYGLLHAPDAPRPILLSLLQDSEIIAKAVAQYSPALIDADLIGLARCADIVMLTAIALREKVSARVADVLIARGEKSVTLKLLPRDEVPIPPALLSQIATNFGVSDAEYRGALLGRKDLPASARLVLVEAVATALRGARIVKGAIVAPRLDRLLRDATDTAMTIIGEGEATTGEAGYAKDLIAVERLSIRTMLHAIVNGHVLFFAECIAALSETPREKVFALLENGGRPALNALLSRCGLGASVRNLVARLIALARTADLADDVTARHYIVTALTEELIVEHDGVIPPELEEAFAYLSEQNVSLARRAARGVMSAFAGDAGQRTLPGIAAPEQRLALPAA